MPPHRHASSRSARAFAACAATTWRARDVDAPQSPRRRSRRYRARPSPAHPAERANPLRALRTVIRDLADQAPPDDQETIDIGRHTLLGNRLDDQPLAVLFAHMQTAPRTEREPCPHRLGHHETPGG